jgi:hypothetical protein
MDAEIAKIPDPLRATAAFDFSLQHEVNKNSAQNDELRLRRDLEHYSEIESAKNPAYDASKRILANKT